MDTRSKLRELAEQHGLQVSYVDNMGTVRTASDERLVDMLRILGAPLSNIHDVDDALRQSEIERWSVSLPPVVVAWDGDGHVLVHLPPHAVDAGYRLRLTTEAGETITREGSMYDVVLTQEKRLDGQRYVARRLALPSDLPYGYHQLELEVFGCGHAHALVMCAPKRAYSLEGKSTHAWGIFAPLYALHGKRSLGTGDLRDLREVTDWVAERGGGVVGTLPMLATFLGGRQDASHDEPFEPSPYAPASRLAWNELYLDLRSIPEFDHAPQVAKLWGSADVQQKLEHLRSLPRADYREQMLLMRRLLDPMAEWAWARDERRRELEAFAASRPEIADYARFRAATHAQGKSWHAWPDELKHGTLPDGSFAESDYRYHLYVQWQTHLQLEALATRARAAGLGLYLDLPVGVHPDGYDFWKYRNVFAMGLSTGAPPDALFAGGQNWAFPPLHPRGVREDRYRYLLAVIRNHLRYAGVLRIDHVMGLHRIYTIPAHAPATDGMYLRYDVDEMYALFSLESHRHETLLLGENLGTVPEEVTQAMNLHGIRGIHVVQYAALPEPESALPPATANEVASLNTHDMPPFRAFWECMDAELRHELGWTDAATASAEKQDRQKLKRALRTFLHRGRALSIDPDWSEVLRALLAHLSRSDTPLVLLNLEDLWGETHCQNVPGTFREYPNWQHRARYAFEEWRANPEILEVLDEVQRLRRQADKRGQVRHDVSLLTEQDVHYFNEGTHQRLWKCLGSHPMEVDGVEGTYFAVWAPSADYVSILGDFNGWDRGQTPLRPHAGSGIWEGFVAGVGPGDLYKYHVAGPHVCVDKTDPLAQRFEVPPRTASVISKTEYKWRDRDWLDQRAHYDAHHQPMATYEVHLGSWMRIPEENNRSLTYRELAPRLIEYLRKMAFTHVELLPIMEHPFYPSWGYQTTGYFAPTSRYGDPSDFMYLVDELHQAGFGVLLDWVPSHFPSDEHALARFDGTHLYEHADPRQGYHPDWRSSIFNYGRYEVQSFLVSSARYWLEQFHVDGLRVDAVASMLYLDYSREEGEWIPNRYGGRENIEAIEFIRKLNTCVYGSTPGAQSIAEESTAWGMVSRPTYVGGLGFGFKWDMGWMHDTLKYFSRDPVHRPYHHNELTFRMIYAYNENFVLPLSHDEVVHGKGSLLAKMPGDKWQRFANLRALYGYMYGQPGKKLLFQGAEIAQEREWSHNESVDWHLLEDPMHAGIQEWVAALNRLYRSEPSLHELDCDPEGFEWIDFSDSTHSVYNFLRKSKRGRPVLVSCNLTPVPRHDYRIGVPLGGKWVEIANSDDAAYGGSGVGNQGPVTAEEVTIHGRPYSVAVTLPPLGVVMFAPEPRA